MDRICFKIIIAFLLLGLLAGLGGCGDSPEETYDPHAGMIQVPDGAGGLMWIKPQEGVDSVAFDSSDFIRRDCFIDYTGSEYETMQGVDVSFYQGEIDWQAVAADGIGFALIRAGYRGWSEGGLFEDDTFRANISGATEAGLSVGVYFFSQATNVEEAREEARYTLGLISGYELDMPVFFDWEQVSDPEARTAGTDGATVTACAVAFCDELEQNGCKSGVYLYRRIGYNMYDLSALGTLPLWVGAIGESYPDFYYEHEIWQYSIAGEVDGINGEVDLNLRLIAPEIAVAEVGSD